MRRIVMWSMVLALGLSAPGYASERVCGWMPTERLDKLLPVGAPWIVRAGNPAGECVFANEAGTLSLSANQILQESEDKARQRVREARTRVPAEQKIEAVKDLGKDGFVARGSDGDSQKLRYFGQRRNLLLGVELTRRGGKLDKADLRGMRDFFKAGLALADDPKALHAALACPLISLDAARKLVRGENFDLIRGDDDTCAVVRGGEERPVLLVTRERNAPEKDYAADNEHISSVFAGPECQWNQVPELPGAHMLGDCISSAVVLVELRQGPDLVLYIFTKGKDGALTAEEKDLLLEAVRSTAGR